jgi:hypothetical protein
MPDGDAAVEWTSASTTPSGAVKGGHPAGLYTLNPVDPWLESAQFQPFLSP